MVPSDFNDEDWKWAQQNPEQYKAMLRAKAQATRASRTGRNYAFNGARIGDLVSFNYMNAQRALIDAGQKPISSRRANEDLHPTVLVLHNNWVCGKQKGLTGQTEVPKGTRGESSRCFHGLNWNKLSQSEQNYLRGVMNPSYAYQLSAVDKDFRSKIDQVNKISPLSITSPEDFYTKFIRPFIRDKSWQSYRKYRIALIKGIKVILTREVLSGAENDTLYRQTFRRLDAMRGPNF